MDNRCVFLLKWRGCRPYTSSYRTVIGRWLRPLGESVRSSVENKLKLKTSDVSTDEDRCPTSLLIGNTSLSHLSISPWSLISRHASSTSGTSDYISLRGVKRMFVYNYLLMHFSKTFIFFTTKVILYSWLHIYEDIYQFWLKNIMILQRYGSIQKNKHILFTL